MTKAESILFTAVQKALKELYSIESDNIVFQKTRKEFEGDFTLVTFPFIKETKKSPELLGQELGEFLVKNESKVYSFNVVKGFLNISLNDNFWLKFFNSVRDNSGIGYRESNSSGRTIMLEYSSPNTNKPLHLGHIRNNLLGYSVSEILKANGHKVIKANLVNDRGIHICKSMLAWQKFGNGETPQSAGMKGDHLVGKYYVKFDSWNRKETNSLIQKISKELFPLTVDPQHLNYSCIYNLSLRLPIWRVFADFDANILAFTKKEEELKENATKWFTQLYNDLYQCCIEVEIGSDTKNILEKGIQILKNGIEKLPITRASLLLKKWETGDKETVDLWRTMNSWVYDGFAITYKTLGVDFDKMYYESNTYLLGKEIVQEGLSKNVFYKKENGSIAIDLSKEGLDEKIVLRSDGTSVYITQDIGTAIERFKEFKDLQQLIYTVGNEQDYHFKVLFKILEKLGYDWAKECYHLSYGMVELPEGKMKSREGTVVDADDLLREMFETAEATTKELGKVEEFSGEELKDLYRTIGLGALKYFILKVDPKKKMLFDPKESIDFNGHTGPFIQYTHARIKSVLRKSDVDFKTEVSDLSFNSLEKELLRQIYDFESVVEESGKTYSPALIANYVYELTKTFNRFYHEYSILKEEDEEIKKFRLQLSKTCAQTISNSMRLLGINVPEKM